MLEAMMQRWPHGFTAREVASYAGQTDESSIAFKGALKTAAGKPIKAITPIVVSWRLRAIADAPVQIANSVVVLKYVPDRHGGTFAVQTVKSAAA